MKLTKRFLAMAIAAFMLLTMAPTMSVFAVIPETGGKFDTNDELSWWSSGQDVGQTIVIHYSYSANKANSIDSIPSGAILKTASTSSTSYKGLINSSGTTHLIAGTGFTAGQAAKSFAAVEGEKVYATVLITRYQNTSEGEVTEEGSELIYMMNGIEVYRETVKNAWFRYKDDGASWTGFAVLGDQNTIDYCPADAENEDKFKYSWFYGVNGTLDEAGITALMDTYNAALTVNPEYTDVKITGNGVDNKIISNLGVEFIGSLTVADFKQRLVASNENVTVEVYASAEAEEAMAEDAIVSEGAVVKTVSSNGFTKLTYAVSEGEDPMNMVWDTYKDTVTTAPTYKNFGREQNDGETVAIHYNYKALNANATGSQLSGLMLGKDSSWQSLEGLFMSNSTNHYLHPSSGNNSNAITTYPAKEGEEMDVVVLITRNGANSVMRFVVNGTLIDFEASDGKQWNMLESANKYIGSGWTQMALWGNSSADVEVKTLGVLTEEELASAINGYCAKATAKNTEVSVRGNSSYGLPVSDFNIYYTSYCNTVAELTGKLNFSEGASYAVYESASATAALDNTAAIPEGAVLKITSANGEVISVYALTEYSNDNITFAEAEDGITATINNLFSSDGKLFLAAYSEDTNGNLKMETVKVGTVTDGILAATLPAADAEGKTIKAFYWNENLVPFAAKTK